MGVIRLFATVVAAAQANPGAAVHGRLEYLASAYEDYSYVGSRKTLEQLVLGQSAALAERIQSLTAGHLSNLADADPDLAARVCAVRTHYGALSACDIAGYWFGKNWAKDSGLFPDFVLACDDTVTFGHSALLELKDTKGGSIASFNSTIPTRMKSLQEVSDIMGSRSVSTAAMMRDLPMSLLPDYLTQDRPCFYLVRTDATQPDKVRISCVEGSFFETIPKHTLLQQLWGQLIASCELSAEDAARVVASLATLSQTQIAQSRTLHKASVKPRLRLMAEVHPDANLHRYQGFGPRTINLVVKAEWDDDTRWIQEKFGIEGLQVVCDHNQILVRSSNAHTDLRLTHFRITHKLNGPHLVLQYQLPLDRVAHG